MTHFLSKKNADCNIAALAGFVIILLFTYHSGVGISPDAVVYSSVAENILQHGYLKDFNQTPVTDFPLFYPAMLSAIGFLTHTKVLAFAPFFNAFLFAVVIYLSGQITERFAAFSKWTKRLVLSCIVLSPCLLEVYPMLWSETIFILLLLLFIIALHRYFQTHNYGMLLGAASIAALAAVTRYAGITLIATGGLLLLLDKQLLIRKKIFQLFSFLVISLSLFIVNLARNYYVNGTLMGHREKAIRSLTANMHDAGTVFCDWMPFFNGHYSVAFMVLLVIIAAFVLLWLWQRFKTGQESSCSHIATSFFLVYLLFMIASASTSRFEELNSRLLSPLFIPFIWIGGSVITAFIQKTKAVLLKRILITIAAIVFIAFQYQQIAFDLETWDGVKDAGVPGYTEDEWKYSTTVQYVENSPFLFQNGNTIYSNAYDAIYFFTGKHTMPLPHKDFTNEIASFIHNPRCYVIWFNNGENPDLVDLRFITGVKKMNLFKQFSDGAIYVLNE